MCDILRGSMVRGQECNNMSVTPFRLLTSLDTLGASAIFVPLNRDIILATSSRSVMMPQKTDRAFYYLL